jgi:hypothetical protein
VANEALDRGDVGAGFAWRSHPPVDTADVRCVLEALRGELMSFCYRLPAA